MLATLTVFLKRVGGTNRPFQFHKRRQLFIRTHNECPFRPYRRHREVRLKESHANHCASQMPNDSAESFAMQLARQQPDANRMLQWFVAVCLLFAWASPQSGCV